MPTNDTKILLHRLEQVLIAFFLLAALSLVIVYLVDSSIYTQTFVL